jgi:monoamine oxidase
MALQEEQDSGRRSHSLEDRESPFLQEELFGGETGTDWEPRLGALEAESPFLSAFEPGQPGLTIRRELEDEFLEESESAGDEAETYDLEAEESWLEPEDEEVAYPLEESPYAEEEPSFAGLPGAATWPPALKAALAAGNRDESQLTDLIFHARHKKLEGRKLTRSDPQAWKDEWVSILKTIVRPALARLKEAKTQRGVGSVPERRQPHPSFQPLTLSQACMDQLKKTRVAVVGGGLGGLMAALRLGRHGIKVTVYEAYAQVGGRVRSNHTFSSGRIIEEGAELIGSFHTTWLTLAREYGMAMISRMDWSHYERELLDVKLTLDKDLSMREIKDLDDAMNKVLRRIADDANQIRNMDRPWEDSTLISADNRSVADALKTRYGVDPKRNERLWKMLEFRLVNDEVAPLEDMNYLGLLCKVKGGQSKRFMFENPHPMGYWEELEIFRCADGCQKLAEMMAREIDTMPGCKVVKETAVTGINIHTGGVKLAAWNVIWPGGTLDKPSPTIPQINYDYVILAIPPRVWNGIKITDKGKKADPGVEIGLMSMGAAVKFFSHVNRRFWIDEKAAPSGGSLKLGQIWEGTDNQTRIDKQGIVLSVFAGPILTGPKGPRPPTKDEMYNELRRIYPGYTANLTKDPRYINWPKEPFIKTGYWTPRKGEIFKVGKKLNEPFHGRLFFAGEHTQMAFFGYMEGALRSGESAANQLMLQRCGLLKKPSSPVLTASAAPAREDMAFVSALEEEIIGADERTVVGNTFNIPNRWICAIDVLFDEPRVHSRATGILIGPRYVLTARHIWPDDAKGLTVSPGRNGSNSSSPFGKVKVKGFRFPKPYDIDLPVQHGKSAGTQTTIRQRDDYMLIILKQDLASMTHPKMRGALGYWGQNPAEVVVRLLEPEAIQGKEIVVIGYPGDTCGTDRFSGSAAQKKRAMNNCIRTRPNEWASRQWRSTGIVDARTNTPGRMYHTADTYQGQSGAPISLTTGQTLNLVGIHVDAESAQRNLGSRVTERMLRDLCAWMNADAGYAIASIKDNSLIVQPKNATGASAKEFYDFEGDESQTGDFDSTS